MRHFLASFALLCFVNLQAQNLPFKMEELSAPQFVEAVEKSANTVILPIGVFEKHGPHMPLGTDLYTAREIALRAAGKEFTVVFPWYYFSQINEARHQPGTIAYSPSLIWEVLQETLNELSRNGFKKIIIVNG
ncbi:MAG: creatininase family protein, partial [Bacteroidota bacterium]|nr:creatininase family protein [Bacteroidota bacterium]